MIITSMVIKYCGTCVPAGYQKQKIDNCARWQTADNVRTIRNWLLIVELYDGNRGRGGAVRDIDICNCAHKNSNRKSHRSCFAFFLTRAVKTHFGTGLKSLDLNKGVGVPLEYEIRLWTDHKRNAGLKIWISRSFRSYLWH